jgi:hypothetical protein
VRMETLEGIQSSHSPTKVKRKKNRKNNKMGKDDVERFLLACEITHQLQIDGPYSLLGFWLLFYISFPNRSSSFHFLIPGSRFSQPLRGDLESTRQAERKMLLGKRPRVPMKRTTSLSEITFDPNTNVGSAAPPSDLQNQNPFSRRIQPAGGVDGLDHQRFLEATVSPRNHRRSSADFVETTTTTPYFLRSCSLCKRRLVPGRDIYMYR